MYTIPIRPHELYHHGVKGQKWGVRNGPPYPIEDKVLKKGTRVRHVSLRSNSKQLRKEKRWMYTYRPEEEWDNKVYKGPFAKYLTGTTFAQDIMPVFEHEFETVKDLKMPTSKERFDAFVNQYSNKKRLA